MIFVTAVYPVKPEFADDWPQITRRLTGATNAQPGCLWFFWSRQVDDPNNYVLVEAYADDAAAAVQLNSDEFVAARAEFPAYLRETPRMIGTTLDGNDWSPLAEMAVD